MNAYRQEQGEDQGRFIVELTKKNIEQTKKILNENSVHYDEFGIIISSNIKFSNDIDLSIEDLTENYKTWLRKYMVN